jgi:hypothetical protein
MTPGPLTGSFRLAKANGGRCFFGEVEVRVSPVPADMAAEITWEEDGFLGNGHKCKWSEEFQRAATRGISIALRALPHTQLSIHVLQVGISYVDSTEDCVAFAACFAVWDALQVCGLERPELKNGIFCFPYDS